MKTKLFFLLTFLTANKQWSNDKNVLNNHSKLFEKNKTLDFLVTYLFTLLYSIFGFIQKNTAAAFGQMKLSQSHRFKVNALGVLTLVLFFGANEVKGQAIVTFPTSWSGTPTTVNASTVAANINTPVTCSRGTGLTAVSSSARFNSNGWSGASTLTLTSNNSYLAFTVTAASGFTLNLNSSTLSFALGSSGSGPTKYGIYTSVGGFTSTANQIGADLTATSTSVTFPSSGYSGLASIQIRIYGWNASTPATGTGGFSSLGLTGTVVSAGSTPPTLSAASSPTVDAPFNVTFTDDANWRSAINSIKIGTTTLTGGFDKTQSGKIVFTPSASNPVAALQTAATSTITISATGYTDATVSQAIGFGAATKLGIATALAAPTSNGGTFATQPIIAVQDQYGNTVTSSTASVAATVGAGTWTIGGTTPKTAASGLATFTNLTATSAAAVTGATITFTSTGLTSVTSSSFNIPAPAPANDLCAGAISLTNGSATNGTTIGATYTTLTSDSAYNSDIWYSYTAVATGTVTVSVSNSSSIDYDLFAYATSCPTASTGIGSGGTTTSTSSPQNMTFSATSGITYLIRLATWNNATGSAITISASQPLASPTLTAATTPTVDAAFNVTFTDNATWRAAITSITVVGTTLSASAYSVSAGQITFTPSASTLLQSSGTKSIVVIATGYANATVSQVINAGAPTTNSTAAISAALAVGASRTISCTAKDQYNNLVSGYTFAYDVSVTNANSTTAESYTIDGTAFTTTATTGNPVTATTNASGVATFTAVLPATIDPADGVSVQVQLANDTTNVGTAFSFTQLASQTITFNALSAVTYGDAPLALTATASSGLAVTYISSNPAIASIAGNTVTFLSNGSVTITASQAGDAAFNAAPNVQQTLTINQKTLTVNGAVATDKIYNTTTTATISGTLVGIVGADVVTFVGTNNGVFASADVGTAIAVTSNAVLGGANASKYLLTQPTGLTASITQAPQTINFAALSDRTMGDAPFSVVATSATSATNALTYSSSNTAVATISAAGLITIVGIGTTTITVAQAGNSNYTAATNQDRTLLVKAVPIAAWDFTGVGTVSNTTVAATTFSTLLISTSGANNISRGLTAAWSTGANSFRTQGFQNNGIATSNTDYFQTTITAKTGYQVSLSTIDANLVGTSTFCVAPGVSQQFAYSLDGTTFTLIGAPSITVGTPATLTPIDLSGIAALQNVPYGTTITFRYYASGRTDTGGWGFSSSAAGVNGLAFGGTVTVKAAVWQSGAWSNTVGPDASLDAVIKDVYTVPTNGTFIAKKLTVDGTGSFTANAGSTVTLTDNLVNSLTADKVVFNSSASLMQNSTLANPNAITYKRATASLAHDFDVVYLGSPLENPTLASAWMTTANDTFYSFNTALAGGQNWETAAPTATMSPAKGFIARAVLGSPGWTTLGTSYTMSFVGKPNNGNYNFTIVKDGTANVHNLLANPYPSALDLIAFSTDTDNSSKLTGNYYFWINNTAVAANNTYANNDYATYNVNIILNR